MQNLPVYQHRQEILSALGENQVIIVESPTGSGKTTQIPIILHEAGYTSALKVGITQPRRIATLSVSDFIKKQLESEDSFVAYKMRFNDTTTPATRIKVMTDGILLMELKSDPLLSDYSVILVDEAHERSLNIDFILGLLKKVLKERPDFKVIVSSATINTKVFSRYFDNAPIISIDARIHPVDIIYMPMVHNTNPDEMLESITSIVENTVRDRKGDVLIFLPGEFDIKTCIQDLMVSKVHKDLVVYPLFGRLSKEEQERVFIPTPPGKTKVVVSTNIAETSVTIDGITVVIDSGVAKINYYNQKDFTSSLVSLPISRSSCEQRAGRAGRTAPGMCYRLYDKNDYESRYQYGTEEILRTDLSEVVMRMSELGIYDYENFQFITRPKSGAITSAEQTLRFIGAIDADRHLSTIGELMVRFPLLPRHSRVIVEGMLRYPNVIEEVIIAVAFLSAKTPFVLPPGHEDEARKAHQSFGSEYGDFISFLDIYNQFQKMATVEKREKFCKNSFLDYPSMAEILHVSEQLTEIVSELGFPLSHGGPIKDYLSCLAAGLLQFVCIKSKRNMYKSLTANQIFIHPGSAWFKELPQFILAGEIVQTSRMYARSVSPLKKEWLDGISLDLRKRLTSLKGNDGESERNDRIKRRDARQETEKQEKTTALRQTKNRKTDSMTATPAVLPSNGVTVYKRQYRIEQAKKGNKPIVIIPLEDLEYLSKQNLSAPKRPRNFSAALQFQDYYIHYGEKFFTILELNGKVQPGKGILEDPPSGLYASTDPRPLVDNLDWILAFCRSLKDRRQLGFVQLDSLGKTEYRFSQSKNCFEALDSSLYALGQLVDEIDGTAFPQESRLAKKCFERLLKSFDA
ncbi:MAG: helicase-related protein [Sphaerochaetaceae bacterium]